MSRIVVVLALAAGLTLGPAFGTPHAAARGEPGEPRILDLVARIEGLGSRLTETPDQVEMQLSADVLFRFDEARLSPRARDTLEDAAQQISQKAEGVVRVDGYTDAKGSNAYNVALSRRRARAVERELRRLVGSGSEIQFRAKGFGEAHPVAPNIKSDGSDNPAGRRKNRRVEVVFDK